jgi:predicted deacylase
MPKTITIAGTAIELGANVKIDLNVARLPSNTMINIPVHVYRGKEDGPVLLLMAAMHGDEVNGIEIIRRMVVDKSIYPKKGTLIVIPILNIYGFLNYSRQVPDGKDVNRSFPGSANGSLAGRIAYLFMKEIFPHIDYGIDFHTGGGNRSNYPQIRCKVDITSHYELAKAFGAPFMLNAKLRDKSLRKAATLKGKPIIVYEAGESQRLDEFAIKEGIAGAVRVMNYLGISDIPVEQPKNEILFQKSSWMRAQRSGLFRALIDTGEQVSKNQVLGTITDPFGDMEFKIKAPQNGYIVGLSFSPVVSQGDALIHIAIV